MTGIQFVRHGFPVVDVYCINNQCANALKVASHPKCDQFWGKIFYDDKIDLTPIFVLKKKFRKKCCFYGKLWTKWCFLHVIAVNGMLTSHCNNLSTHHYYLTYHPCFDTQFCYSQTTQRYFRTVALSSRKKQKRLSCPFVPMRVVKRKKGLGWQNCR